MDVKVTSILNGHTYLVIFFIERLGESASKITVQTLGQYSYIYIHTYLHTYIKNIYIYFVCYLYDTLCIA